MNIYSKTEFLLSANKLSQCPADKGREIAFAGHSNVGKSSVINRLTGIKKLARTSKTPGRTQLLNFFKIDDHNRIVDLPGYGFAKVPEKVRHHWGQLLQQYFEQRGSLTGLVLIMDIRHPMKTFDIQILDWCLENNLPVHVVLNKADKLSRGASMNCRQNVSEKLLPYAASVQCFSALKGQGISDLQALLDEWLSAT